MVNPPHQRNNPEIAEVPATTPIDEIVRIIRRDGGIIIKNFITPETVKKIDEEIAPYWEQKGVYKGILFNAGDPPLSGLVGKSRTMALECLNNPVYRDTAKALLRDITYPWWGDSRSICISDPVLAVAQAFTRGPKTAGQPLHRDDITQHYEHEEGSGDSSLLGLLVAGTDTTYENGATQVIVGSHKWGDDRGPADPALCSTAEMKAGDAVMIIGSVWHGAGENKSENSRRNIYSMHMVKGCLRSDENQFLAIPREVVESYPAEVQQLIGYSVSQPYCGWVEMDDPIKLVAKEKQDWTHRDLQGIIFEGPGSENFKGEKPIIDRPVAVA